MPRFSDIDGVSRNLFQIGAADVERTIYVGSGDPNDLVFPSDFTPNKGDQFEGDTELWRFDGADWNTILGLPQHTIEHTIRIGRTQQMTVQGTICVEEDATLCIEGQVNSEI